MKNTRREGMFYKRKTAGDKKPYNYKTINSQCAVDTWQQRKHNKLLPESSRDETSVTFRKTCNRNPANEDNIRKRSQWESVYYLAASPTKSANFYLNQFKFCFFF